MKRKRVSAASSAKLIANEIHVSGGIAGLPDSAAADDHNTRHSNPVSNKTWVSYAAACPLST